MARNSLNVSVSVHLEPSGQFDMIARLLGYAKTNEPSSEDIRSLEGQLREMGVNFKEGEGDEGDDQ